MTPDQAKQLRQLRHDFLSWAGGCEPESEQQIDTYIEGSLGVTVDADETRMDLLMWMQEPRPLNPAELFIISAITRAGIAENLNDCAELVNEDEEEPLNTYRPLTPDDDRLTAELCKDYAAALGEIVMQPLGEEEAMDAEDALNAEFCKRLCLQVND